MQIWLRKAHTLRRLCASANQEINGKIEHVHTVLTDALEATRFISASAQQLALRIWVEQQHVQAYLETDPSARGQPESYTARYKTFACSQVEAAIAEYDKLADELGEEKMQEIRNDSLDFGLAIADNLLARDQLKASIRDDESKLERKKTHGLRKDDLIFCDGPS